MKDREIDHFIALRMGWTEEEKHLCPLFTTDIAHAWEAVKFLVKKDWNFSVVKLPSGKTSAKFFGKNPHLVAYAMDEKDSKAISLAAKRAMEIQDE